MCVCVCVYVCCHYVPSSSTRINCLSFIFSLGSLYFTRQSFSRDMNPFNFTALFCILKKGIHNEILLQYLLLHTYQLWARVLSFDLHFSYVVCCPAVRGTHGWAEPNRFCFYASVAATKTNQRNINTCNMTPAVKTIHSFEGGMKYSYKGQCVSLMCIHFKDVHKVHVAFVQHILWYFRARINGAFRIHS